MATLGDAFIEIHADASPFERELIAELEAALIRAEAVMRQRGRDSGNAFSDGVDLAVRDRADNIGETLAEGLADGAEEGARQASAAIRQGLGDLGDGRFEGIKIPFELDDDEVDDELSRVRRSFIDWAADLGSTLSSSTTGLFGVLSGNLGQSLGFIPIAAGGIALLVGGIIGLSQVLNPLVALLSAVPGLLLTIGVIGLTLNAVFSGLGDVLSKAFKAKDAKELAEVLKGLTPQARAFVESILSLDKAWQRIATRAQESFLKPFGGTIDKIVKNLEGPLSKGISEVAASLGAFFALFGTFLASAEFKKFVEEVFPAVAAVITVFGPPLLRFFKALVHLADATIPFVQKLFLGLGWLLDKFSAFIEDSIKDGSFQGFLDQALTTLGLIGQIAGSVFGIIKDLLTWLNESGEGDSFLQSILFTLDQIGAFLASDDGKLALKFLVDAAIGAILIFGYLFVMIGKFIAFLETAKQAAMEFSTWIWELVVGFLEFLATFARGIYNFGGTVGKIIYDFLFGIGQTLFLWALGIKQDLDALWKRITDKVAEIWRNIGTTVTTGVTNAVAAIASLKTRAMNALSNIGSTLYNAGVNLINGFINGIKNAIPGLTSLLNWVTNMLPSWKGPEDVDKKILRPAGMAVMQGFGEGIAIGAKQVMGDLSALTGMISMTANPNTFNFGPGAIQQNFNGNPTPAAATSMGNATGGAIANTVNQQTMRAQMRAA